MKKIFMMAALLIGTYTLTVAQTRERKAPSSKEAQAENQATRMQEMLKLTAKQKAKVYEVNMDYLKKMETARADKSIKIQDIHAERNNKLKSILTNEQYMQWRGNNKPGIRGGQDRKAKLGEPQEKNKSVN